MVAQHIPTGSVWEGTTRSHPWRVRIIKEMASKVYIERLSGNRGSRSTMDKTTLHVAYRMVKDGDNQGGEMMAQVVSQQETRKNGGAYRREHGIKTISLEMDRDFLARYQALRGTDTHIAFVGKLLDALEAGSQQHGQPLLKIDKDVLAEISALASLNGTTVQGMIVKMVEAWRNPIAPTLRANGVSTQCANLLGTMMRKYGQTSMLDTLDFLRINAEKGLETAAMRGQLAESRALVDSLNQAVELAVAQRNGETKRADDLQTAVARLMQELDVAKRQSAAPVNATATSDETQSCLLDFVDAFAGSTQKADPSGELVVEIPSENQGTLFAIWVRAVKALGFAKKAA